MSCYIKHKINWMEVHNIKLSNWMRKRQLYVSRKSLFWGLISVHPQCVVIWTLWFIFFIGFWYRTLIHCVQRSFQKCRAITRNSHLQSGLFEIYHWQYWQWKKTIKKLHPGVHPLFIPLLLLQRWLLYSSGILSFKICIYLCMTYILQSAQLLRRWKKNF